MKIRIMQKNYSLWQAGIRFMAFLAILMMNQNISMALTVDIKPEKVDIGIGYHGTTLTIAGQRAADEAVIIKISSPINESHLKYKGKAAGIFWMKMGDMKFKPVSSLYIVHATDKLQNLLSSEQLLSHNIGYEALSSKVEIETSKEDVDKSFWLSEFIKFKENENLYSVIEDAQLQSTGAENAYQYQIDWPYQASPGVYQVEAFAVKDHQVVQHAQSEFTVKRVGIVAILSDMAFNNAAVYGIIAVLVAVLVGFSVGFVFKGGGAH